VKIPGTASRVQDLNADFRGAAGLFYTSHRHHSKDAALFARQHSHKIAEAEFAPNTAELSPLGADVQCVHVVEKRESCGVYPIYLNG
jgi:hypothetical protein